MNTPTIRQHGFGLLQVVLIVVVLGIIAAVIIPKFLSAQRNSHQIAIDDVAEALATASAHNRAGCLDLGNVVTAGQCITIAKCSDIAAAVTPALALGVAGAPIANMYNLAVDTAVTTNGLETTCTLQINKDGTTYTQTYVVTGAGN